MVIEKMGWQYKDMLDGDVCNIHSGMIFEEYSKVQHFPWHIASQQSSRETVNRDFQHHANH